ncbi:hypothetical protein BpHYR1_015771, partial [Brachionus plicatilis]
SILNLYKTFLLDNKKLKSIKEFNVEICFVYGCYLIDSKNEYYLVAKNNIISSFIVWSLNHSIAGVIELILVYAQKDNKQKPRLLHSLGVFCKKKIIDFESDDKMEVDVEPENKNNF